MAKIDLRDEIFIERIRISVKTKFNLIILTLLALILLVKGIYGLAKPDLKTQAYANEKSKGFYVALYNNYSNRIDKETLFAITSQIAKTVRDIKIEHLRESNIYQILFWALILACAAANHLHNKRILRILDAALIDQRVEFPVDS